MPGIYIHIPFCRQACHYCNFHFSVSQKRRPEFVQALKKEIALQKDFLKADNQEKVILDTIYFGGGTPSLLEISELDDIFSELFTYYQLASDAEVTLESNPDDLGPEKLAALSNTPVNRLSIGIQSFHASDLKYMNRSHTAEQAEKVLPDAEKAGFKNITADLIYGTPGMSDAQWKENIMKLISHDIPHISAYSLTVEKKTALEVFIRKGKAPPVDEEQSARQFEILCEITSQHGYEHYEISNFGKPGFFSRHNLSYWSGVPYLGLGPSAHSYLDGLRRWNIANTCNYIDNLQNGQLPPFEQENLDKDQQYNEYVMTALRTMWGVNKELVKKRFGDDYFEKLMHASRKFLKNGKMQETSSHLIISAEGKFLADGISAEFFV
ncbi:MAG: radical SAM family heme chaperone HemW [Bacteroidetes bacterium]|nr:MAG: radical SAM family heme chaperone HemW [Bacteroidota bacterium]